MKVLLVQYDDGSYESYELYQVGAVLIPDGVNGADLQTEFNKEYQPPLTPKGRRKNVHYSYYAEQLFNWLINVKGFQSIEIDTTGMW